MQAEPFQGLIGIVGPCSAGKSTLTAALTGRGIKCRHIAQEHSYVQNMWERLTQPDLLVFLDVSYEESKRRRQLDWTFEEYRVQRQRLAHALHHADLYLYTDDMTPDEVLAAVLCMIYPISP